MIPSKIFTAISNHQGRTVSNTLRGSGSDIIGELFPEKQFQACFEYTRGTSGGLEVMQFDSGRVSLFLIT